MPQLAWQLAQLVWAATEQGPSLLMLDETSTYQMREHCTIQSSIMNKGLDMED